MFGRDPINKLNMMLHAARRYFHDDNSLPNLEALKNIYQVVTQQLLNSRERYIKKHDNQQPSESPLQAGDLILIKNHTAKSFEPKYKVNYRIVKIHGNNMDIQDYRGNILMVHVTDLKKTTLMEQVADDYEELGKQGRFSKMCIPRGYIPDLNWTTVHEDLDQPIKLVKQPQSVNIGPTRMQSSSNRGQQSANCTKRLFLNAMDTYSLMGQESLKT